MHSVHDASGQFLPDFLVKTIWAGTGRGGKSSRAVPGVCCICVSDFGQGKCIFLKKAYPAGIQGVKSAWEKRKPAGEGQAVPISV